MATKNSGPRPFDFEDEPTEGEEAGKLWHQRIDASLKWRQRVYNGDKMWLRSLKLVSADHWMNDQRFSDDPTSDNPRDEITVNVIGSTVKDFMAFLFKYNPKFLLRARRKEAILAARLKQSLINYWWREKGWKHIVQKSVWDYLIFGHAIVKTGWVLELDAAKAPDKDGNIEWDDAVRVNEPTVRRVDPFHFIVDPEAPERNLETSRWCAESIHKPLRDVLVNTKYDKSVIAGLRTGKYTPACVPSQTKMMRGTERLNDDEGLQADSLVRLFEVWDKKFHRYFVLLDGVDKPLFEGNWPYADEAGEVYLDGFPYVFKVYDALPNDWYGQSLPFQLEDQQLELNRIRTLAFTHRRRNAVSVYGATGQVGVDQLAKLQNAQDGEIVQNLPGPGSLWLIPSAPLPEDNYRVEQMIQGDINRLSGADQLTSGGSLPSRTSATEITARQDYTGRKIDMRVDAVDCLLADVTRQVLQHMEVNMEKAEVVRVEGPLGDTWEHLTPQDAKAEVDLEITTVSATREDETEDKQQAIQTFGQISQMAEMLTQQGYAVNWPKVFAWVMLKQDVKEADEFLIPVAPPPPPDPAAGGGVPTQPVSGAVPQMPPDQIALQQAAAPPQSGVMGAMNGALGG